MASLPPRQANQRRSSPQEPESSAQIHLPRQNSEAISTVSEDSQTVLLNSPRNEKTPDASTAEIPQASQDEAHETAAQPRPEEPDVRKCWICFNDETEDTPLSSEWKSPCPCALVAHEACLLDWVADMEAPTSRRSAGATKEIKCPQCKSRIHLSRPRSLIVDAVRAWDQVSGYLAVPWGLLVITQAVHSASFVHGVWTIFTVFGKDDGKRILQPLIDVADQCTPQSVYNLLWNHWRLTLGVPLIPPILISSRTNLADSLLPILPVIFFATSPRVSKDLAVTKWPPSAALSIAMLPYLRGAYNAYHDGTWGKLERQWLKEIQPRARQSEDGINGAEVPVDEADDMLEINVDIVDEWEVDDEQQQHQHQHQGDAHEADEQPNRNDHEAVAPPLNAPPLDRAEAGPEAVADAVAAGAAPAPEVRRRREQRGFNVVLPSLVDTVLGALVFPGIAAAMGGILKLVLPRTLTSLAPGKRPTGLLQARWGRSIVGGCAFVVLKDAVMLYVRWRMAQNHRHRKVLNYDKKTKKIIPDASHSRPSLF